MQLRTLQEEVAALNSEVMRLRLMVHKCTRQAEEQHDVQRRQQQALHQAFPVGGGSQQPSPSYVHPTTGLPTVPLPGQPLAVLPQMFSGLEGTARLFRVLMETYPWLVPPEMRDAQAELAQLKRDLAAAREEAAQATAAAAERANKEKKKSKKRSSKSSSAKAKKAEGGKAESSSSSTTSSSDSDSSASSKGTTSTTSPNGNRGEGKSAGATGASSASTAAPGGKPPSAQGTPMMGPTPNRTGTPLGGRVGSFTAESGVLNLRRPVAKRAQPKLGVKKFQQAGETTDEEDAGTTLSATGTRQVQQASQQAPAAGETDFNF